MPLASKIACAQCGGRYKNNGTSDKSTPVLFHRCADRGHVYPTAAVMAPLEAQIEQIAITDAIGAQVVQRLRSPESAPPAPDTTFLRHQLANGHADGRLSDQEYLDQMAILRAQPVVDVVPAPLPDAAAIMAALRTSPPATRWPAQRHAPPCSTGRMRRSRPRTARSRA